MCGAFYKMSGFVHFHLSWLILGILFSILFCNFCSNILTLKIWHYFKNVLFRLLWPYCSVTGCICCSSVAWQVKVPSSIRGLRGSCLVIPCSYDYYQYPPKNPKRVVWYQYVDRGYPLVHDSWHPNQVIQTFRGKTQLITTYSKSCTLQILPLDWTHHRRRLYPWVDPEHVGRRTYRFFDTTVTIEVLGKLPVWSSAVNVHLFLH